LSHRIAQVREREAEPAPFGGRASDEVPLVGEHDKAGIAAGSAEGFQESRRVTGMNVLVDRPMD
jgi:hypothetical protein